MMKRLLNIRIPSVFGIIVLLIGVGLTSYLVDKGVIFEGRAAPEKEPLNIAITNISPTGFSVMYTTDAMVPGSIKYDITKDGKNVALDDRDKQAGTTNAHRIHHISVTGLTPSTTYYFSILSGDALFTNNGEPYTVKTAAEIPGAQSTNQPITGTVTYPEGTKDESLVLLNSETNQLLSSLVQNDGSYSLPLATLRTKDLVTPVTVQGDELFDLLILSPNDVSQVKVLAKNTHPVSPVLFGQSYDFTISTKPLSQSNAIASPSAFPQTEKSDEERPTISIENPTEKEKFTDQQPSFEGTALPGETIEVIIHSDTPITDTIKASSDGSWTYRPKTPLAPGEHTITIKTKDVTGTLREFTRSFTVTAQGSGTFIEPSVSPSMNASPTPTVSFASPTPTQAVVIASASATPVIITATPTIAPTVFLTATPMPTRQPLDAAGSEEIRTGVLIAVGTIIGGLLVFFLLKGSTV